MSQRIFLLSPAHSGGRRAQMVLNQAAEFPLAQRLREEGASLGEVFTFLSGLYFRGKLAYARAFARVRSGSGILVIAPGRGLVDADTRITLADLRDMAKVSVSLEESAYRTALERDARALAAGLELGDATVLLGSIATDKYVDVLEACLGDRLLFPSSFVGRGDMSRGGLMLRCARDSDELDYVPVTGAVRHGPRPPRLDPWRQPA